MTSPSQNHAITTLRDQRGCGWEQQPPVSKVHHADSPIATVLPSGTLAVFPWLRVQMYSIAVEMASSLSRIIN
ncbi:hypothetical protein AtubIFM55763_008235 [Aspergillus tubingensis]|nr:hypothetical protein AtubIFM55763_008235 [Aspergillus tubingensis]